MEGRLLKVLIKILMEIEKIKKEELKEIFSYI